MVDMSVESLVALEARLREMQEKKEKRKRDFFVQIFEAQKGQKRLDPTLKITLSNGDVVMRRFCIIQPVELSFFNFSDPENRDDWQPIAFNEILSIA